MEKAVSIRCAVRAVEWRSASGGVAGAMGPSLHQSTSNRHVANQNRSTHLARLDGVPYFEAGLSDGSLQHLLNPLRRVLLESAVAMEVGVQRQGRRVGGKE